MKPSEYHARLLNSGRMQTNAEDRLRAGLCSCCVHVKVITSDRGSRFYQCLRGLADPSFRKYPVLPVLHCRGYEDPEAIRRSERS